MQTTNLGSSNTDLRHFSCRPFSERALEWSDEHQQIGTDTEAGSVPPRKRAVMLSLHEFVGFSDLSSQPIERTVYDVVGGALLQRRYAAFWRAVFLVMISVISVSLAFGAINWPQFIALSAGCYVLIEFATAFRKLTSVHAKVFLGISSLAFIVEVIWVIAHFASNG